jgi:hypothetical protein
MVFVCKCVLPVAIIATLAFKLVTAGDLIFLGNDNRLLLTGNPSKEIENVPSVADAISSVLGGLIGWSGTNPSQSVVVGNMLYRPSANLLVVVEGLQHAVPNEFAEPIVRKVTTDDEDIAQWVELAGSFEQKNEDAVVQVASADDHYAQKCLSERPGCEGVVFDPLASSFRSSRTGTVYTPETLFNELKTNADKIWGDLFVEHKPGHFIFEDTAGTRLVVSTSSPVEKRFLLEMGLFSIISTGGNARRSQASTFTSIIYVWGSTKPFFAQYPDHSPQRRLAEELVVHATKHIVNSLSSVFPRRLTTEIVAVTQGANNGAIARSRRAGGRNLLEQKPVAYKKANASGYTAQEVEEYQIFLWVSIVLTLAVVLAVCLFYNMEIEEDTQLYAAYLLKKKGN